MISALPRKEQKKPERTSTPLPDLVGNNCRQSDTVNFHIGNIHNKGTQIEVQREIHCIQSWTGKFAIPNEWSWCFPAQSSSAPTVCAVVKREPHFRVLLPPAHMSSQVSFSQHSSAEKRRVLDAYRAGRTNWLAVAANNGISRSMAYRIADTGRVESLPRGGTRPSVTKVTSEVKEHLEAYLNDNCTYTMETMRRMLILDLGVDISTSTISRHLLGMLYTVKQTRVEPTTCNNETNKTLRQAFAKKLKQHQREGNFIVYFDETNFNVYCKRGRGRAKRGERATVVLPPSKGANLQVQCAVNSAVGVVLHRLERGSIRMEQNAQFIEDFTTR
ncbi:unnamed protein product [Phytophthora fragariaefolia]|uniref:Unnamed protein product n=1 Tax=Phytophthora fragariaefolia TaxID=1490495 RepID=A0A9W6XSK8_9STRA|nr:unnamed protein product [Phytophthora fragariaefolia]